MMNGTKRLSVRARINVLSVMPPLLVGVLVIAVSTVLSRVWATHASQPGSPVPSPAPAADLATLCIAGAVAMAAGCAAAVWLRGHLAGAINDLLEATRRLDKGQAGIYIPRRSEDELAELAGAIERLAERLQNREDLLRQAQGEAEAASRAKAQFLTHIGGEIRTPLTAILSYCEQLQEGRGGAASYGRAADAITRNARQLHALISNTLDLAKVEAGMVTAESIPAVPADILEDAVSAMRQSADDKGLKLELKQTDDLANPITTDPARLKQIIVNLLSNAIKFTHTGGVRVSAEIVASKPPMLRVCVEDTGVGMAPEQVRDLSKPSAQTECSTARHGVGLPLAQRLAGLLGGSVLVESTEGAGSTFTLQVLAYPATTAPAAAPKARNARGLLAGARVMVVEDALDTRRVLKVLLEREGALVMTANNGQEAVDFLSHYDLPCVVLMDIEMPVLDGFGATQQLRESGFTCPIVAVTAHTTREDRERCLEAGCNDFLPKPIRREELIQLLAGWAAHAATEQSAREELNEAEAVVVEV